MAALFTENSRPLYQHRISTFVRLADMPCTASVLVANAPHKRLSENFRVSFCGCDQLLRGSYVCVWNTKENFKDR